MDIMFEGKRALVTGAGKGIGRAIALALSRAGADVIALSRTQDNLDSLKEQCQNIRTVCVDLANWDCTRAAVENIGHVDMLVNNAGTGTIIDFMDSTEEIYDETFNVNVKAVMNVSQVVAKTMISKGSGGSIVNISSQASKVAIDKHAMYCASKGALDQLTRVMALELGKYKIRVNCVNPTIVLTVLARKCWSDPERAKKAKERLPLGRFAELNEVVEPVLFLLSEKASMITGDTLMVDGGWTAV